MPDVANSRWERRISHHHRRQVSKASTKRRKAGPTLRDVLRGGWQTERFGSGQQCHDSRGYTNSKHGGERLSLPQLGNPEALEGGGQWWWRMDNILRETGLEAAARELSEVPDNQAIPVLP